MNKYTGVKALAFVSIIAAISLMLVLITTYTTNVGLILMFILPLCSTLVTINVEKRFVLIYASAVLLMSLINIQLALFVVIPSLISGIVFGSLIKLYIQGYFTIFINSIILLVIQIIATYLIKFIYEVDMIKLMGDLLKLTDIGFDKFYFFFLYFISLTQSSITYLIITNELKKFNVTFNEKLNKFSLVVLINISLILTVIGFSFFSVNLTYLFLGFSYYFGVILAYYIFSFYQHKKLLYIQCSAYFLALVSIILLFNILQKEYRPILFISFPISQLIGSSYIIIYQKFYKKFRIDESLFDKLK